MEEEKNLLTINTSLVEKREIYKNGKEVKYIENVEYLFYNKYSKTFIKCNEIPSSEISNIHFKNQFVTKQTKYYKKLSLSSWPFINNELNYETISGEVHFTDNWIPIFVISKGKQIKDKNEEDIRIFVNIWNILYKDISMVEILQEKFTIENSLNSNIISVCNKFLEEF